MGNKRTPAKDAARTRWNKAHPEVMRRSRQKSDDNTKLTVLAHYSPDGTVRCSWQGCDIADPDMLSIDHIHNDGAAERRQRKGSTSMYRRLKVAGFPPGYQTLCHNHQWKKEIQRRRDARKA